ncbi:MAG: NAD(P)-dependent oxidoreductase [Alphaproteobacteria bacterium]
MKILVLGATGETGSRLVTAGMQAGHQVTALVRNPEKLARRLGAQASGPTVLIGDALDESMLTAAMAGQDVVINAAGNAWDGASFAPLVQSTIRVANKVLGPGGRFWLFGGAGVLDVPGTKLLGVDLPGVPAVYQAHRANFEAVKATQLDWSMLCPGPMVAAPAGRAHQRLRLAADTWPFSGPRFAGVLPRFALTLAFASHRGEITIAYEDAVAVIMEHLGRDGPFSRKRVGVALPRGLRLSKPGGGASGNG